ncbi:hypothetical protein Tco_1077951 [Tanacetum coccineum]
MAPEFWCQTTPTEFWCHDISGVKLHFADVAPLLKFGTKSLAPRLFVLLYCLLESIRSYFFNGHDPNSKRTSWVKWKNVLASKEKGGLGVSSLYALNRGLMFKWVWRFFTQNTSLWSRVIKAIHGENGKVGKQVKSAFPSYWMDIVHEINILKNQGINLLNCM